MRVLYAFAAIAALLIAVAVTCAGPKHESTASVEIGRDLCGTPSAGVFESDSRLIIPLAELTFAHECTVSCTHTASSPATDARYLEEPRLVLKNPHYSATPSDNQLDTESATRSIKAVLGVGALL